jgi:hypothetical protein
MSGNNSINRNTGLIGTNIASIDSINASITDLTLGVATKDEKDKIKYTGYNDWRLKLEIYSNIDDTPVLTSDLLFYNSNSLEYVDYIHLLADSNEIDVSSNLKFVDYKLLTAGNKVYRNYQEGGTYQDYIIEHQNDKLLLRYTLNILLKKNQVSPITTHFDSINLAQHNYFINYEHQSDDIRNGYSGLIKGWNTIDWFFIYDPDSSSNIALGFNPLDNTQNTELYSNVELISGILPYNPNGISENTKSFKYTVSTINNPEDQYIIESQDIPERAYYLTKTYLCNFNSTSNDFNSNITFDMTNLGDNLDYAELRLNSITLSNIDPTTDLNVKNFRFSNITNNVSILFDDEQLIKPNDSYTFNSNLNIKFNDTYEFDHNDITSGNNINITTNFEPIISSLSYNIEFEFYLEIRSLSHNTNLVFNQQEAINRKSTNNKIIFMNDGSIGIGTDDSQGYSLYVNNISSSKKGIYCADDITILSDEKYKTNIKTIENPIEKLMALRGVSYNRIDRDINENRLGFIAQEVQKVLPEACDGNNGIKNTDIVALLVEGFKEICKKIDKKI